MAKQDNHFFVTDGSAKLNYKVDEISLLLDLKTLIKEYYVATLTNNGNTLLLSFNNGQKFIIKLEEVD